MSGDERRSPMWYDRHEVLGEESHDGIVVQLIACGITNITAPDGTRFSNKRSVKSATDFLESHGVTTDKELYSKIAKREGWYSDETPCFEYVFFTSEMFDEGRELIEITVPNRFASLEWMWSSHKEAYICMELPVNISESLKDILTEYYNYMRKWMLMSQEEVSEWTLRVEGHDEQCAKREMKGWEYSITDYKPRYLGYCTCKKEE